MKPAFDPYSLHPSFAHWSAMLDSLQKRTGKNMVQWMNVLKLANANTPAECRALLKSMDVGASTISLILDQLAGKSPDHYNPHAMVAEMFKGPKSALLPLYQSVLYFTLKLGGDVKACPCQTIVPFYRHHVFAQAKPSTQTRLDLGLALGTLTTAELKSTLKATALIDTGGFARKDRITHRIALNASSDFDETAKDWLCRAYSLDSR